MPEAHELGTDGREGLNVAAAVLARYTAAAQARQPALCCPVRYDDRYLAIVPAEIVERDYGCGDPSRHVAPGDSVLDLGCGAGKICYIAAQVVGRHGRVIGVDCNDEMLALARRYRSVVADRLGYENVDFHKAQIQDLRLDLQRLDDWLRDHPVADSSAWRRAAEYADHLRETAPLIPDETADVAVSNCVLNLVRRNDRRLLFSELHRVLKHGGRAVISDIVSDRDVPERLQRDPELWTGCISGAFREDQLVQAFAEAGFSGVEVLERQAEPWTTVESIEFRSMTVRAWKGVRLRSTVADAGCCGPRNVGDSLREAQSTRGAGGAGGAHSAAGCCGPETPIADTLQP
jgi:ubiquinone/menaquinone biosynthesis C-methylase UbiE